MARRTKAEAARTRQRIITAALALFYEKGYFRTTFADIARRIRLTKGAVYWHFRGKPELLLALIAHMEETRVAHLGRNLPEPATLEGLKGHLTDWAAEVVGNPETRKFFNVMLRMDWSSERLEPVRLRFDTLQAGPLFAIRQTLARMKREGLLRPDTDLGMAEALLLALWTGLVRASVNRWLTVDLSAALDQGCDAIGEWVRA